MRGLKLFPALAAVPPSILGLWWAWRYPLPMHSAVWVFAALCLAFALSSRRWPVLLLGLWPLAGWADWSGWLLVEESDFLIWACLVGVSARHAFAWSLHGEQMGAPTPIPRPMPWGWVAVMVLGASASATWLLQGGWADAAWLLSPASQYHQPQAALRMLKPYTWALVVLVLFWADRTVLESGDQQVRGGAVFEGMAAGLAACSLVVIAERYTHTGLLNFSTDYRVTGPFWEMHVGGAALDAYLAAALPISFAWMRACQYTRIWPLAALAFGLGGYAAVVTFSRGTYAAAVLGVGLTFALMARAAQQPPGAADPDSLASADNGGPRWLAALTLAGLGGVGGAAVFGFGGYRGAVALLVCVVLLPSVALLWRQHQSGASPRVLLTVAGLLFGAFLGAGASLVGTSVPKGIYAVFGLLVVSVAALVLLKRFSKLATAALGAWVLWACLLTSSMAVNLHWSEGKGVATVSVVHGALGLLALATALRREAFWPNDLRWQINMALVLGTVPLLSGMLLGGAYMQGRAATTSQDMGHRMDHWRAGLSILQTPDDWTWGTGLSRFPIGYQVGLSQSDGLARPGHHEVRQLPDGPALLLVGSHPPRSLGEQHRVIQRVPSIAGAQGPFVLHAQAWVPQKPARLEVQLCGRHLLYVAGCVEGAVSVRPLPAAASADEPQWVPIMVRLSGEIGQWPSGLLSVRPALALKGHSGHTPLWLRNIELRDGLDRNHVSNGSFDQGLDRWFFTSDRSHLPWSAKNVGVHLLVEQGWVGLLSWAAVWAAAMGSAVWCAWRGSALHAGLAGGLLAMLVVGGVDSLLNHTRITGLLLMLLAWALSSRMQSTDRAPVSG